MKAEVSFAWHGEVRPPKAPRSDRGKLAAALEGLAIVLVGAALFVFLVPALNAGTRANEQTLEGTLSSVPGTGPVLKTQRKNYPLAGWNQYIFHTLQDKRLQNDKVRLTGTMRANGNFEVRELYTLHHGELYRIRYYCETCNIAALEPGKCVCCQQPTELQEIPVNQNDKKVLVTH